MKLLNFLTLFQIGTLVIVLIESIRIVETKKAIAAAFFTFGAASVLLSDLYWLAYDILRPDTRMPFAANEIGEWAMFLLYGASLKSRHPLRWQEAKGEIAAIFVFISVSVFLWGAWSGEWIQDLLTGAAYGYYLICLFLRIKEEDIFSLCESLLLGITCTVLLTAQVSTLLVPASISEWLTSFCNALLLTGNAVFLGRAVLSFCRKETSQQVLCRVFAAFAWIITAMYMSSGIPYSISTVLLTFCFALMPLAFRKEAESA